MKSRLLLWLLLMCSSSAWAQNLNIRESFEGTPAEHGYTSNTFIAGTLRYFFRASDPVTVSGTQTFGSGGVGVMASEDGSFFWACEGVRSTTSNTAPTAGFEPGVVTLNGIPNSENYTNIRVTVAAGEPRNSTNIARQSDHLRVQYCYGSATGPFNTVGEFTGTVPGGTSPWTRIGAGSTGPTTILGSTFTDHTFPIPAGSGLLYVRIEADYNGGQKEIAFDNIRVTGTASAVVKPTITSNVGTSTLTFAEGTATPLTVFSDLTVGNPAMASNPTLTGATVTLSPYAGVEDNVTYTIPAGSGITLSSNTNGVLTFAGASGVGNYELLLESIKYKNTEVNNATAGDRTFTFVVRDGATESIPLSRIITVTTAINGTSLLPRFETFDSDGEGTRYASNTKTVTLSGTTFGFLRLMGVFGGSASPGSTYGSSSTFTNLQGTGYWFVSGTKNIVAGNIGYVKLAPVNTTGFVNLHFKVKAGAGAGVFASTDFLRFAYSLDGGQTWTVFANYFGSDNAGQGQLRLNGVATNPQLSTTATDLDFALPAAVAGTAVEFRVEVYVDADEIVFDNIQITGTQQPTVTTGTAGSITTTTASISNNTLTTDGGANISDYGVVYVTGTGTPTTSNLKVQVGTSSPGSFPANFSANLSGLTASTQYTARAYATNSVGTSYGAAISFTTAASVSGTTVVTNVSCSGGSNGAINLTPTGGVGPYTFNWGGGVTTEDRTGLSTGTYSVTITDAVGATGTVSATVTQPTTVVGGSTVVTNVACFGGSNGAINLTPSGGTGSYIFNWLPSGPTTEDRTGLSAGTYSVQITDGNGCTGTVSATVTQPPTAVGGTTVVTNVACFGGSNGAINLTPSGGTGPYTFNWLPGGPTTEDRTGLSAGTYSVQITDGNGCTGTVSATVTQPATAISLASGSQTNVTTTGGSNGTASVTPTGGTPAYTYDWAPGTPPGESTASVSGLSAGIYTVTVTDANGCTATRSFTITQPTAPTITGFAAEPALVCVGSPLNFTALVGNLTGSDTYTLTNGSDVRTGSLASSAFRETLISSGTGAQSFTLTVSSGGQRAMATTLVTVNALPVATLTNEGPLSCTNTSVILTASGGGTYQFSPGASQLNGGNTATVNTAGTYSVTVTSSNGCTATASTTVDENKTPPTASLASSGTITCTNTSVTLTANTGAGLTYRFGSGATQIGTSNQATVGVSGTYSVTVTGANGCSATAQTTVTGDQSVPTASLTNNGPLTCSMSSVTLTASGGGTYRFSSGATQIGTSNQATVSTSGTYSVTVTSANGCSATAQTTVTGDQSAPTASLTNDGPLSCSKTSVTLTASGGGTYRFSAGATQIGSGNTASVNTAGLYSVTVTSTNGCSATASTTVVGDQTAPTPGLTNNGPLSCTMTSVTLTASGGGSYRFSSGATQIGTSNQATVGVSGTYSVTVTGANGCSATAQTTVTGDQSVPTASLTNNGPITCSMSSVTLTATGGTSYRFSSGASQIGSTNQATVTTSGLYSVTVTNAGNGCSAVASTSVSASTTRPTATISGNTTVTSGGSTTLTVSGGTSQTWSTGETTASITVMAGTYSVTVTNASGCSSSTSVTVSTVNSAPVATANANQTATVGVAFSYTVNAFSDSETPNQLTYTASISPANGFSFDPNSRVISGTPSMSGVSQVSVTATDPGV